MKRWALLTVCFYVLVLTALAAPVIAIAFAKWWGSDQGGSVDTAFTIYQDGGFWIWLAVLALGQGLMLLVPVAMAERRLPSRRRLLVPVVTAAFFLMALLVSGIFSVLCAIIIDDAFKVFTFINKLAGVDEKLSPSAYQINSWLGFLIIVLGFWMLWGWIFFRSTRADDPNALIKRATRWLVRGSILELLVAIPSHIIIRNRNACCAPMGTFWGITTGLSVMLLCFGPGVFFLFAERIQRSRPKSEPGSAGILPAS